MGKMALKCERGIIICGGGYKYFPSAWVNIRLLRSLGCGLPIELWVTKNEVFPGMHGLLEPHAVTLRVCGIDGSSWKLPANHRWQWVLKPWSLLHTAFREALLLDADNTPLRDVNYLFEHPHFKSSGAVFWPDISVTQPDNPIWQEMELSYREEPEFESGQLLLDTQIHREPLELALRMNLDGSKYYTMIWGDKDTFRFAFHKYGRPFYLIPHAVRIVPVPGGSRGEFGVMCQHDYDGDRIFQHRNMSKWNLLRSNPRIPGMLFEDECRKYIGELKSFWNGRTGSRAGRKGTVRGDAAGRHSILRDLQTGPWLLEDRRPRATGCCGALERWTPKTPPKPWWTPEAQMDTSRLQPRLAGESGVPAAQTGGAGKYNWPRRAELEFKDRNIIESDCCPELLWWDLEWDGAGWLLQLSSSERTAAVLRSPDGLSWRGRWSRSPRYAVLLHRVDRLYPWRADGATLHSNDQDAGPPAPKPRSLRFANHAFGIGDAITGLYAALGAAKMGHSVVYHTRFPRWLRRVQETNLRVTDLSPPRGTPDMDSNYAEQLRYGATRLDWYIEQVRGNFPPWSRPPLSPFPAPPMTPPAKSKFLSDMCHY